MVNGFFHYPLSDGAVFGVKDCVWVRVYGLLCRLEQPKLFCNNITTNCVTLGKVKPLYRKVSLINQRRIKTFLERINRPNTYDLAVYKLA